MSNSSLVSVIIPVYNCEKYAKEAIDSVLAQTYTNIEIICIDDGSADSSLQILQSFGGKIRLVYNQTNLGIGQARNNGIAVAKGEFLAFLDADDLWLPKKIQAQISEFIKDQDLHMSFTLMKNFISPDLPPQIASLRDSSTQVMPGLICGTFMIKTESFHKIGLFNPAWRVGEFVDWLAKARAAELNSKIIQEVFLHRRIHETNTGVLQRSVRSDYLKIVKEALDRKRKHE